MRRIKLSIFIFSMFFTTAAYAANVFAVLEIVPKSEVNASITEMRHLTDELRRQAILTLPESYTVLTRDNIISLIPTDEAEAKRLAESNVIDIGRAIGAEYISQGSIGEFGEDMNLSVELYETMNGKLLGSIVIESHDIKGLLAAIREQAPNLFSKIPKNAMQTKNAQTSTPTSTSTDTPASTPASIPTNINTEKSETKTSTWVAIGLDVLGAAALGFGFYQNIKGDEYYTTYKNMEKDLSPQAYSSAYKDVEGSKRNRNISYGVGGALLLSGIAIHIWF